MAAWGPGAVGGADGRRIFPPHAVLRHALDALRQEQRDRARALLQPVLATAEQAPDACVLADPAPLLRLAQDSSASLDWVAGHLAYEVLVAAGHSAFMRQQEWMARRASLQQEFHALFEEKSPVARLAAVLEKRLDRPVRHIATARMRPGLVAMALYRHEVTLAGRSQPVVLVEKVFTDRRTDQVKAAQQDLLFRAMPAARLLAPAYHGLLREGRFTSSFWAMVEGEALPVSRWDVVVRELLYRYWNEVPASGLKHGMRLARPMLDALRAIAGGEMPAVLAAHLPDAAAVPARVAARLPALEALVAAMPVFVLHDDLHAGNILVDAQGVPTVIDWDRWWLAPIGAGWPLNTPDATPPALSRITWARPLPPGVGPDELMVVARMAAVFRTLRGGRHQQAARHLAAVLGWEG